MSDNVSHFRQGKQALTSGGGGSDLEARVKALEDATLVTRDRLARIEARLESFPTIFATKEDLHREINAATSKFVGWMFTIFTLYVGVMSGIIALVKIFVK